MPNSLNPTKQLVKTYSHDPRPRKLLLQQVPWPKNPIFTPGSLTCAAETVHEDDVDLRFGRVGGRR